MAKLPRTGILVVLLLVVLAVLGARMLLRHPVHKEPPGGVPDLSLTSPLNQPGGGYAPQEAYEPYSALYQAGVDEPLAFVAESDTDIPQVNGSCLKPSTPQEREMNDAFVAANEKSHPWEARFAIPAGYRLVSRTEAGQIQNCLDAHGGFAGGCARFAGIRHVRFLGVPGFDHAHTRALVSIIRKCGGRCGSGGIFEMEKTGGTWRRAETTDFTRECSWMY